MSVAMFTRSRPISAGAGSKMGIDMIMTATVVVTATAMMIGTMKAVAMVAGMVIRIDGMDVSTVAGIVARRKSM